MQTLAEKKRLDAEAMALHKARLDEWLGPDPRDEAKWRNLPKTKPVSQWWGGKPLAEIVKRIPAPAIDALPRHKPYEFGRAGTAIAAKDVGKLLAVAREMNAQTDALKPSGLLVLETLICAFWNKFTGRCDPSATALARKAGVSIRTVFRALARLRASGLLSWRRRFQNSSRYFLGVDCQKGSESPDQDISRLGKEGSGLFAAVREAACALKLPLSLLSAYRIAQT